MAYVHDIDPFAIQFPSVLQIGALHVDGIRWYGLSYLSGFIFGFLAISYLVKKKLTPMKVIEIGDFTTAMAIGVMAGGRLGYCLFYAPHLLFEFSASFPFWGALKVYEGGMASHGGIIGVILACVWWSRRHKMDLFHVLDLVTFGGCIGFFFGRLANFINGELWGREASPDFAWAVKFPQEMMGWTKDSLSKLLEITPAVEALGIVKKASGEVVQLTGDLWRNSIAHYRTDLTSWQIVNDTIEQMMTAIQSGNTLVAEKLAPYLTARHPSQLYQAVLEGLLIFIVLAFMHKKMLKPGLISAAFGIMYAIARIIGEQFRMPDAHIGFQLFGLTRGQWLSIAMLLGTFVYLWYVRRRGKILVV